MYMADKASDDGTGVWVSKSNMAYDLEMTDRAVRKHIKEMIDMSVIIEAGQRKCRNGYTVDYSLNMDRIRSLEGTRKTPEQRSPLNDVHPYPCTTFRGTPEQRSPKPSIEPSIEPNNTSSKDDGVFDWEFDELWGFYPRKVGRGAAKKALKAALKKTTFDVLLLKLIDYTDSIEEKDKQYIPHLATWLNQERWTDEA